MIISIEASVGMGYRTPIRLVLFYLDIEGQEIQRVALLPFGCKAISSNDFCIENGNALCCHVCPRCQSGRRLALTDIEQIVEEYGIQLKDYHPPSSISRRSMI